MIRALDMRLIDDLFGMGSGYVLDFSDRTFADFFVEELGIQINNPKYLAEGTSKAKRLRYLLKTSDSSTRISVLSALWEYRGAQQRRNRIEEKIPDAEPEFRGLIERLGGKHAPVKTPAPSAPVARSIDSAVLASLKSRLIQIAGLEPQPRGYEYERFLKDLFDTNGLSARSSFRLVGEQIDGSFESSGETYLLEAKWTGSPIGVADLRAFNAKVEEKAAWTRGVFVSNSGFTEDGLAAFGRGKRVVCMDGLDLYEMLDRGLTFVDVLARKVRRAAESGNPFIRVRDLYP
jgi:predicted protein tyrosine phosphatase